MKNQLNENGQRNGYWEKYHDNGNIATKGNYLNGERHGYWGKYWSNGNLQSKGNYVNGKKEGRWEEYCYNGTLRKIYSYSNNNVFYWEFHAQKYHKVRELFLK